MDMQQIAEEVLAAVGGKANVVANDICMTRLRIVTKNPSLVDTDQLSAARGVLGIVRRGGSGIEVVFGPGKVEGVHDALVDLTGVEASEDAFVDLEAETNAPIQVHINPSSQSSANPLRTAAISQASEDLFGMSSDDEESDAVDELVSLLASVDDELEEDEPEYDMPSARLLVINGPNINMLGIREPGIYGKDSYQQLLELCKSAAAEAGFSECVCYQSNHEGDIVDAIQDAYGAYDGIVINPGAYTHTSIAILDAAKAVGLPMVEVHISKVDAREEFRQVSYIRAACFETITGLGIEGYRKAINDLADHIGL